MHADTGGAGVQFNLFPVICNYQHYCQSVCVTGRVIIVVIFSAIKNSSTSRKKDRNNSTSNDNTNRSKSKSHSRTIADLLQGFLQTTAPNSEAQTANLPSLESSP